MELNLLNVGSFVVGVLGVVFASYKTGVANGKNGIASRIFSIEKRIDDGFTAVHQALIHLNERMDKHLEAHK